MKNNPKKVAVLGAGSWGTALAHHLSVTGSQTKLWGRDSKKISELSSSRENSSYHRDIVLDSSISFTSSLNDALSSIDMIVLAVPSSGVRNICFSIKSKVSQNCVIVNTAKGVEDNSNKLLSVVVEEELGEKVKYAVLSGPSFAAEVIRGLPTAVTIASSDLSIAKSAADLFHKNSFRVYTSSDVKGVELGGVVKNVIALAAGMVDGQQLGHNARAALITRGVAEIKRLVEALGGKRETVSGLSGLGDLLLTSTGDLSRNRTVGLRLGRGEELTKIVDDIGQVVEGVVNTKRIKELAATIGINMPIVEEVYRVLYENVSVSSTLESLLSREAKEEG